ncbi:phage tail protein [Kitasatospora mediocidica]|uniref:phage tail protein n=1 Tax=Kitasatospora mediocidica TaxID=58352 RepID=UPI000568743C|nr:phage tail protein [Kitasatospora mediocidica]
MPLSDSSTLALANRFAVKVDGNKSYDLGSWSKVDGLDVQWKMCDYRAGDAGNNRWYFPGFTEYSTIKLVRAVCDDSKKVKAWLDSNSFKTAPYMGSISLMDPANKEVMKWELRQIVPSKWSISGGFEAGASKVALEMLELTHLGFLEDDITT